MRHSHSTKCRSQDRDMIGLRNDGLKTERDMIGVLNDGLKTERDVVVLLKGVDM